VVPPGTLKIMTDFLPPAALGRIQPGQPARLRLDGFPWMQYGAVSATVASVASEVRDGWVRVELAVRPDAAPPIPLQHGLPGTVEVEVDHVPPATLVLRAAGRLVTGPGTSRDFLGGRGAGV
jgi:multidrug resistance efflux pump